jgi:CBS domain-containing protein
MYIPQVVGRCFYCWNRTSFNLTGWLGGEDMTQVRDIMTKEVEIRSLLDSAYEFSLKMKDENVGTIPIIDNERIVGMITDRDIVLRCVALKTSCNL